MRKDFDRHVTVFVLESLAKRTGRRREDDDVEKENGGKMVVVLGVDGRSYGILHGLNRLFVGGISLKIYVAWRIGCRVCFFLSVGRRAGTVQSFAVRSGGTGPGGYKKSYEKAPFGSGGFF